MEMFDMLIKNIGALATPRGSIAKGGEEQGKIDIIPNAWIAIKDGKVAAIETGGPPRASSVFDASGKLVTPGLVDPHTHMIFGGWRERELSMKLSGKSYLDILADGGGILSTVRDTRAASAEALRIKAKRQLRKMLELGVTTCEVKSGYGLSVQEELKILRVIKALANEQVVELVPTFLGAHAVPEEYLDCPEEYVHLIIREMLPAVASEKLAEFCDVFCEDGIFDKDDCCRILLAGQRLGLKSKCHSDEIKAIGGTEMAGSIGAVSCEHLICCRPSGIAALAASGTIACCLPATSFYLGASYAPARAMIHAGVPVAFGSDFNPGSCPISSLQIAMNIGCYRYRMSPAECLTAVTLNAAAAICREKCIGSLEVGKQADIVVWDAPNLEYLFYRFGENLVSSVFKKGRRVI